MHAPVQLEASIRYLNVRPTGTYLDATTGLGNHTAAIARLLTTGFVLANDRDAESIELARRNTLAEADRIRFHQGPFSRLREALTANGVDRVDGLLADLGVSRFQLTEPERGFSMMADGPLDMRMDRTQSLTASDIVNYTAEKALADLIFQLGEERRSRRISQAIVRARPIQSTRHLAKVIEEVAPRTGRLHPATQTFMALRLACNSELEELDALLALAPDLVADGGRIVIITFMSLEDRRVKRSLQALVQAKRAVSLTKHVVRPTDEEVARNAASRSSKLRAVELIQEAPSKAHKTNERE